MVIPLAAISGLGLLFIFNHHRLIFLGASAIYLYSLVLDTDLYFNHNGRLLGEGGNAGHKQAVALIRQLDSKKLSLPMFMVSRISTTCSTPPMTRPVTRQK